MSNDDALIVDQMLRDLEAEVVLPVVAAVELSDSDRAELEALVAELDELVADSRCKIGCDAPREDTRKVNENKVSDASELIVPQCASTIPFPNIDNACFTPPTYTHTNDNDASQNEERARWDGCEIATAKSIDRDTPTSSKRTVRRIEGRAPSEPPANTSTSPVRQTQRVRPRTRRKSARVENFLHKSWRDLSPAEKFVAAVWHAAGAGGLSVSLNLGIGREASLLDHDDPRTLMRKSLDRHLRTEGFGKLPIAWVFEITPRSDGERLHLHGVIDTHGLTDADLPRLKEALRKAGSYATGAIGGQRQVDLATIPDAPGWADYLLKDVKRTADFLGIDNPFFLSDTMTRRTRASFETMRSEVRKRAA